jgi:hypothetical protein
MRLYYDTGLLKQPLDALVLDNRYDDHLQNDA